MIGKSAGICFSASVLTLLLAVLLATWGFPKIVQNQIQKSIQLENSSMMFEKWRKIPMALDFKIYVFNVTNAEDISNGDKPRLQEVGPYVYKEYRERDILGYGDNDTIRYMQRKQFVFDQEASGGLSEEDEVTVIHFSYLAALLTVHDMMPGLIGMINPALEQLFSNLDDAFLRVKVRDLFFDGIPLDCSGNHSALGLVCSNIKALTPPTMRPNEDGTGFYFSMFSHLNRTPSGPFEMVRGTQDIKELGHIVSFKDKDNVKIWGDQYCNMLNGSDGTIFPPIDQSQVPDKLYTFQPDICRSLSIDLAGNDMVNNMTAYYYEISDKAFAAKSANPNNKCFCKKNWSANHDGCLMMGLMNLMPCQGAPAIASMPHYFLGSDELLDFFEEGIHPDREKHKTFVYLEPTTGVVLKGVQRLQFNIELRRMKVPQLEKVPTGLFPLLWIEESAELPASVVDELKQAHSLLKWVEGLRWTILGLAILATILAGYFFMKANSMSLWPNKNSVSFIRPNGINISKSY